MKLAWVGHVHEGKLEGHLLHYRSLLRYSWGNLQIQVHNVALKRIINRNPCSNSENQALTEIHDIVYIQFIQATK